MGWFSNSKCKWCSIENESEETINLHQETCKSGNLENPIKLVEFFGIDLPILGTFDSYKDIPSKLEPLKDDGWVIARKVSSAHTVQWIPNPAFDPHGNSIFQTIYDGEIATEKKGLKFNEAIKLAIKWINELNPKYESEANKALNSLNEITILKAKKHEKLLEFDAAAEIYKELMMDDDVIRVRKLQAEQGSVKVTQKVVHGDEVTKTEIKDSVLNRSNVGGGSSKAEELREAKALLDEGIIDDDEFKQMKKEILEK